MSVICIDYTQILSGFVYIQSKTTATKRTKLFFVRTTHFFRFLLIFFFWFEIFFTYFVSINSNWLFCTNLKKKKQKRTDKISLWTQSTKRKLSLHSAKVLLQTSLEDRTFTTISDSNLHVSIDEYSYTEWGWITARSDKSPRKEKKYIYAGCILFGKPHTNVSDDLNLNNTSPGHKTILYS